MIKVKKCTHAYAYRCSQKVKATIIHYCFSRFVFFFFCLRDVFRLPVKTRVCWCARSNIGPSRSLLYRLRMQKPGSSNNSNFAWELLSRSSWRWRSRRRRQRQRQRLEQRKTHTGLLAFFYIVAELWILFTSLIGMGILSGWLSNIVSYVFRNCFFLTEFSGLILFSFLTFA